MENMNNTRLNNTSSVDKTPTTRSVLSKKVKVEQQRRMLASGEGPTWLQRSTLRQSSSTRYSLRQILSRDTKTKPKSKSAVKDNLLG